MKKEVSPVLNPFQDDFLSKFSYLCHNTILQIPYEAHMYFISLKKHLLSNKYGNNTVIVFYPNHLPEHTPKTSIDRFEAEFGVHSASFLMITLENKIWSSLKDDFDLEIF